MKEIKPAVILTLLFVFFTGLLFPIVVWSGAQLFFPFQANGSFAKDAKGRVVGSYLIGQAFTAAKYFHPRPSAAGTGYDPSNSGGTNLGPISSKLILGVKDDPSTTATDETYAGIAELAASYRNENQLPSDAKLPADAVTHSASGLDPDISPANAELQAQRVADARGVTPERVRQVINKVRRESFLKIWGEPRVNVLELNLSLDKEIAS